MSAGVRARPRPPAPGIGILDPARCSPNGHRSATVERPHIAGKFFFVGDQKLYLRGATYGAFRPDPRGEEFSDTAQVSRDFALMAAHGLNAVRIPHTMPPRSLLDAAHDHGLRVMVGLSAEQYAGYLTDTLGAPDIADEVRRKVRVAAGHPALLCYAIGNEIPASVARWLEYYPALHDHLRSQFPCLLENDRVVVFDLRG